MSSNNKELRTVARQFASADDRRAWIELGVSLLLWVASLAVGLASIGTWWIMLPAILLSATMGLRIYMIQHDCLHRSFFTSRKVNDVVGSLISPIAMTPYKATRYIHNLHHTYVSDLDRRDTFEIYTMTLKEYQAASPWAKVRYRLYRTPLTLILLGPFIFYLIIRRVPLYGFKTGVGDLILHNVLLAAMLTGIWYLAGWAGIGVWAASIYFASVAGALNATLMERPSSCRPITSPTPST